MKILGVHDLITAGGYIESSEGAERMAEIEKAVILMVWPPGSSDFAIYPESGKRKDEGNGVVPIRKQFAALIHQFGWDLERPFPLKNPPGVARFGAMDASRTDNDDTFIVEWETGNISSSHRSMNKICLGLSLGVITAGVVIVPGPGLAPFLTDRIGNSRELRAFFPLWSRVQVERGYLGVIEVEHDREALDVPRIPKIKSGRGDGPSTEE